jgi:hypothetical protein
MKKILLLILTILYPAALLAQDFAEGKYDSAEMQLTRYDKDTSAHAVVLNEFGKTWISSADHMPLVHEYHVKIKIFDDKAFNKGDVSIRLYHDGEDIESVRDIKGLTFYKDDNGLIQKAELNTGKIYHETLNKHTELLKFALPNLRKGCIIEYSYVIESPYRHHFRNWAFQSDIPKVYSEYEAHIPAIYEYNIVLRGYLKLSKNTAKLEPECFSFYGTKADCSNITYGMKDIPAFVEESYMTAPKNFLSAMYFEMSAFTNQNGVKQKITQEWQNIDRELKSNDYFGTQMRKKDLLKDRIPATILTIADTLAKAEAIYAYMQKWFKWNHNFDHIYSEDGIKKALDAHSGNVGDINLSLIAALNAGGINTDAVVLSTRDNGLVNKLFPQTSDFDYVVARLTIGNKVYMLDATDPLLDFGMLPLRCINDQGRVMSLNKPSYWIDMAETNKSTRTSALDLTIQPDGKIKGTVSIYYTGYAAYQKRQQIKKFNTVDEYIENLAENNPRFKIAKPEINNLDSLNLSLTEKFEITMNGYDLNHDNITFDPAFWDRVTENPFKLTERTYPVDMGSTLDQRLILTLHYPDNLVISKQPQPVAMGLPNKGGKFITSFDSQDNTLNYSQVEQLTKSTYQPEEYPYLKELYNKMIQNQKATVVFSKKP